MVATRLRRSIFLWVHNEKFGPWFFPTKKNKKTHLTFPTKNVPRWNEKESGTGVSRFGCLHMISSQRKSIRPCIPDFYTRSTLSQ